jgi:hypothetical protein
MAVPQVLIVLCFVALMIAGAAGLILVASHFRSFSERTVVNIGTRKIELRGPAWLVAGVLCAAMLASPVIAGAMAKRGDVTEPPPSSSIRQVQQVPDPTYKSFTFRRDVSFVDLRAATTVAWFDILQLDYWTGSKPRVRPGVLKNYMVIQKTALANEIHLVYSTRGRLDIRCLTHQAKYEHTQVIDDGQMVDRWDVIANVSAVPVGQEFEIAVEATMWNGFGGRDGDDYATYGQDQNEAEEISTIIEFPNSKPFTHMDVFECPPSGAACANFQGASATHIGTGNNTYYWRTTNTRSNYYYRFKWTW